MKIDLNAVQMAAVSHTQGPCLVVAGAGTGKTRVIAEKCRYLVQKQVCKAKEIIALTFTQQAAREMQARLRTTSRDPLFQGMMVTTFHGLCLQMLKPHATKIGLKKKFTLCTETDQLTLLKALAPQALLRTQDAILNAQTQISHWKNSLLLPEQAFEVAGKNRAVASLYQKYQAQLQACSLVDFDDLLCLSLKLLETSPELAQTYRDHWRYWLVDEYQDTNLAQYTLFRRLLSDQPSFTVVGDDDQAIYAWRGANADNLNHLISDFPDLTIFKLEENYRCAPSILTAANQLIEHNPHVIQKQLKAVRTLDEPVAYFEAETAYEEVEQILQDLLQVKRRLHIGLEKIAVLYRSHHQAKLFETILTQRKIPHQVANASSFWDRVEIQLLMAYLRLLIHPEDDAAFLGVINLPEHQISASTVAALGAWSLTHHTSLFEAAKTPHFLQQIPPHEAKRLLTFMEVLERHATICLAPHRSPIALKAAIDKYLEVMEFGTWMQAQYRSAKRYAQRLEGVEQCLYWLTGSNATENDDITFSERIERVLQRERFMRKEEGEAVPQVLRLMTIHAAKGLEFDVVYVAGLEEGTLPHHSAETVDQQDEERRLLYVAMTRAKRRLVLTRSKHQQRYNELIPLTASRFLNELPLDQFDLLGLPLNSEAHKVAHFSQLAKLKALLGSN